MTKMIFLLSCFFMFTAVQAEVVIKKYLVKDYKTAKSSLNKLHFESKSTKLGFITSDFDGYAKNFSISYDLKENILDQIKIKIVSKSFDTDSSSRNDKMNELCLESEKYPEIVGTIAGSIDLNVKEQNVVADFIVKDQPHKMTLKFLSEKKADGYKLTLLGSFSLKEWQIPDPSIVVAKVRDQFDLVFETML